MPTYLPYDETGRRLLTAWTDASQQVQGAAEALAAISNSLSPRAKAAFEKKLAGMKERRDAAKLAHDRYRYYQANPTHSVCAAQLNAAADQAKQSLFVVAAIHEGTTALAA